MFPYIHLFSFEIPTYGLISLLGVLASGFVSLRLCVQRGIDKTDFLRTAMISAVGLFFGAHLLYGITRMGDIIDIFRSYGEFESMGEFITRLLGLFGGMVFYGGLYGGLLAGFAYARKKAFPSGDMADVFAVFIPLFHAFGRIGCFFAGCCYGVKSEWGIGGRVLSDSIRESAKRFPVQLLEGFLLFVLFSVMLLFCRKAKLRGNLIFVYLLVYAVLRFCLEFLRGDEIRGKLLMFSTSQWISILTIGWVGVLIATRYIRKRKLKM